MSNTGIIYGVNGPVIYLKGDSGFKISEMVYVGPEHLVGEIIGLKKGMTTVQVFEETTGLKPGDTVTGTGDAISVLLGPGIIHNIFDGIQRPLEEIAKASGKYISRGVSVDSLLRENEEDIVNSSENKDANAKSSNDKKNIMIKVTQQNGKENIIKVPFKFVKLGLNIGNMFGLSKDISDKIATLAENDMTDIVNIDTENGEHIAITLD